MIDKEKHLSLINEAIAQLSYFAKLYGIESLFLVGDYCRELYLDTLWRVNKLDVVSVFDEQHIQLGYLFASEVLKTSAKVDNITKTASVVYKNDAGEIEIIFQSRSPKKYMRDDEVVLWMQNNDIDATPMLHNLYGRQFTINTLACAIDSNDVYDTTDRAMEDLTHKTIRSLLPSDMLVKYDPLSIFQAMELSLVHEFHIDMDMKKAMRNTDAIFKSLSSDRIAKEIIRILHIDPEKALEMIKTYEFGKMLSIPEIKEYLKKEVKNDE